MNKTNEKKLPETRKEKPVMEKKPEHRDAPRNKSIGTPMAK